MMMKMNSTLSYDLHKTKKDNLEKLKSIIEYTISENKILDQINQICIEDHLRLNTLCHTLNNGILEGIEKAKKIDKDDNHQDLCIKFLNSNFVVVFNIKNIAIKSIRVNNGGVFETVEEKKMLQGILDIESFIEGEVIDGLKLTTKGFTIETELVCNCVEVEY